MMPQIPGMPPIPPAGAPAPFSPMDFESAPPPPVESAFEPVKGVSATQVQEYQNIAPDASDALKLVQLDKDWVQVAKEYKILTGDKNVDGAIWRQHQAFIQGVPDIDDPLMADEDAVQEFRKRVLKRVLGSKMPKASAEEY